VVESVRVACFQSGVVTKQKGFDNLLQPPAGLDIAGMKAASGERCFLKRNAKNELRQPG
jgi:hypothetical protein